jgi:hypothetical protein
MPSASSAASSPTEADMNDSAAGIVTLGCTAYDTA